MKKPALTRVGEVRPSQLFFTYGVGAIVDLPKLSAIVTGLEDWPLDPGYVHPIVEDRLLLAVRYHLRDVQRLLAPPLVPESGLLPDPFSDTARVGVPVAAFPRWMVCPRCQLLAPLSSNLFDLDVDLFHADRTVYRHTSCNRAKNPEGIPARFLVACEQGHLDDFPWRDFVHRRAACPRGDSLLKLIEYGPSGEARDLEVSCECGARRRLSEAFGEENRNELPLCRGRRPHLRDFDPEGCTCTPRALILGASNTWFPRVLSIIAIPVQTDRLKQLVQDHWAKLQAVTSLEVLRAFRAIGQLSALSRYTDDELWNAIETKRRQEAGESPPPSDRPDLKGPEWQVLTQFNPQLNTGDFQLRPVAPPSRFSALIQQVVLVERLREVHALVGFTRVDAPGELTDYDPGSGPRTAPISRRSPAWVPADQVRGEGIFIQFNEQVLSKWLTRPAVQEREAEFLEAHKRWRTARRIEPPEGGFAGMRYVFLHTFSHALMRQLSLECGYASASIRERIYARAPEEPDGPMAGLLIYTSAPDSEGTLGGLVNRGEPETLERHIAQALEAARLCASDPLCAEHPPSQRGQTLHAAACHACLFAPETACERGNKYLDRSTLVKTVERSDLAAWDE